MMCQVFRSSRQAEMYLYVEKSHGLADVPQDLMARFGTAEPVLSLLLTPERKLARVDVADVLSGIADCGFYLQLPPVPVFHRAGDVQVDSND